MLSVGSCISAVPSDFDPLSYINESLWHTMSLGLERIRELMRRLGNPQQLLRFVHVAGTNGKGSSCAFLARILQEAGYKTGLFTSPYIEHFEERICVNGVPIGVQELRELTWKVRAAAEDMAEHPTEFELMSAVAFLYFACEHCDIVVAEVGLGGRLDSTNVIESVDLCLITPISLDHEAVLGASLGEIATEKAGIIKPEVPVVSAVQKPEVRTVLQERAAQNKSTLRFVDPKALSGSSQLFGYASWQGLRLGMEGSFQLENAACVLEACQVLQSLGWSISAKAIESGLSQAFCPGRFEYLSHSPDVIVDGAHNVAAMRALACELHERYAGAHMVFMVGVMADKNYQDMMLELKSLAREVICITPPNPRALPAEKLACVLCEQGIHARPFADITEAVSYMFASLVPREAACICGSLYSVSEVKKAVLHMVR